jgi:hypothetical protein
MNTENIKISEDNGTITLSHENSNNPTAETLTIWFDCNCPFCRRHLLDNLNTYVENVSAGSLTFKMIPVAFLTQYSANAGAVLMASAHFGTDLYLSVIDSFIFHGISESVGNDEKTVDDKIRETINEVIVPYLESHGHKKEDFSSDLLKETSNNIKTNTQKAIEKQIQGVPHIEKG